MWEIFTDPHYVLSDIHCLGNGMLANISLVHWYRRSWDMSPVRRSDTIAPCKHALCGIKHAISHVDLSVISSHSLHFCAFSEIVSDRNTFQTSIAFSSLLISNLDA